jgi:hypothetical protein
MCSRCVLLRLTLRLTAPEAVSRPPHCLPGSQSARVVGPRLVRRFANVRARPGCVLPLDFIAWNWWETVQLAQCCSDDSSYGSDRTCQFQFLRAAHSIASDPVSDLLFAKDAPRERSHECFEGHRFDWIGHSVDHSGLTGYEHAVAAKLTAPIASVSGNAIQRLCFRIFTLNCHVPFTLVR